MQTRWFNLILSIVFVMGMSQVALAQVSGTFTVSRDDAENAIGNALVAEGIAEKISATIGSNGQPVFYTASQPVAVEVKTLKADETARTFSANLLFTANGEVLSAMPVSGRYDATVSIPVLSRQMKNGEVIAETDLTTKDMPQNRLRPGSITDAAELIGFTPRRAVSPNRPIRKDEIQTPAMVKKGGSVQMTYQTNYMTVQTMGTALEDGSEGARIRVKNEDSHAIVYATVKSESEVLVGAVPQVVSASRQTMPAAPVSVPSAVPATGAPAPAARNVPIPYLPTNIR